MPAGRKPAKVPESIPALKLVEDLAGMGLTKEDIADIVGTTEYQVDEGQFSAAYKRGRAKGKKDLLQAQHRRALNDKHPGCVQAANKLLGMVHHLTDRTAVAVARIGDADLEQLSDAELEAMIAANRSKGGE